MLLTWPQSSSLSCPLGWCWGDLAVGRPARCGPARRPLHIQEQPAAGMPYFHPLPDSLSRCGALSLWLAARFKSFTKIPKTFCRLDLRRRGCRDWGEHERLLKTGSKPRSWAQGGRAGGGSGAGTFLSRLKICGPSAPAPASAAYTYPGRHICVLGWEAQVGGPQDGRPPSWPVSTASSPQAAASLSLGPHVLYSTTPGSGVRIPAPPLIAVCPLRGCFTSLSLSSLPFKMGIRKLPWNDGE